MERGRRGAVQGLCGDTGGTGGCWRAAQGFSLVQALPGCTRWLRAIPASPREISAGEHGGGGRRQGVGEGSGQSRVPWGQIPLLGVFPPTPCHPGAGHARGPGSHSHPAGSHAVPGSGCRLGGLPPLPAWATPPAVVPRTAAPAAPRVPHHAGELRSRRAVTGAALPALSANLWQHRCVLCSAWSSSGTNIPPHPAVMVRGALGPVGRGTWQRGAEGRARLPSHPGARSAGCRGVRSPSRLSWHPQAGSTALQAEQAARRRQHLSQGDNKSYQCKPIRKQQDNPRDNLASTEASSAPCQCCGFTDKCYGWGDCGCAGTCRLPGGSPHPCAAGQAGGDPATPAMACSVG